jgi:hypothetical protein
MLQTFIFVIYIINPALKYASITFYIYLNYISKNREQTLLVINGKMNIQHQIYFGNQT